MFTKWKSRKLRSMPVDKFHISMMLETLEVRDLLTSFLFVEYGDNFPSGTLATTQGALRDVANDATPANRILGPTLNDGANAFNAATALNIVRQAFTVTERAQILAVVQRAYLPLDITVVELTATAQTLSDGGSVAGAANMNDVINTLRGGNAAFRDAYVFVATFNVDPGGANPQTYTGGGGTSPGSTVLDTTDLSSATNTHDDVAVVYSSGGRTNNTLNNISHEAGHCFGLRHSITDTATTPASAILFHQAEIMSYVNTNNTTSSMFTRYPMIHGDNNTPVFSGIVTFNAAARTLTSGSGNFPTEFNAGSQIIVSGTTSNNNTFTVQSVAGNVVTLVAGTILTNEVDNTTTIRRTTIFNYNDIAARAGQVTIYDQLSFDANIGANPNFTFVSGTGAHDIITIVKNGANADVTVQAFTDAAYTTAITVPGEADTTYSYSIPLTLTILVYGGDSNDRFVIDADLGVNVQIDGMLGTDQLIVKGKSAASATYAPGTNNVNELTSTSTCAAQSPLVPRPFSFKILKLPASLRFKT